MSPPPLALVVAGGHIDDEALRSLLRGLDLEEATLSRK